MSYVEDMDWLRLLSKYTNQLADTVDGAELTSNVPSCPAWDLADLAWHLVEVQDFWTWIITNRPASPEHYPEPTRPPNDELTGALRSGCRALVESLEAANPTEEAWSWSDDHTVGFTYRRQAHEAFVHLADACLAAAVSPPNASPDFGADGIDELISINLSMPEWGSFTPGDDDRLISINPTDTANSWTLRFGTFSGTSPNTGTTYTDEPQVQPSYGPATTIVSGDAATLDLWMWGRADTGTVTITGNRSLASELRAVISGETQ